MKKYTPFLLMLLSIRTFAFSDYHDSCSHILASEIYQYEGKKKASHEIKELLLKWAINLPSKNLSLRRKIIKSLGHVSTSDFNDRNSNFLKKMNKYIDENFQKNYASYILLSFIKRNTVKEEWKECIFKESRIYDVTYFAENIGGSKVKITYQYNPHILLGDHPEDYKANISTQNLELMTGDDNNLSPHLPFKHPINNYFVIKNPDEEASFKLTWTNYLDLEEIVHIVIPVLSSQRKHKGLEEVILKRDKDLYILDQNIYNKIIKYKKIILKNKDHMIIGQAEFSTTDQIVYIKSDHLNIIFKEDTIFTYNTQLVPPSPFRASKYFHYICDEYSLDGSFLGNEKNFSFENLNDSSDDDIYFDDLDSDGTDERIKHKTISVKKKGRFDKIKSILPFKK